MQGTTETRRWRPNCRAQIAPIERRRVFQRAMPAATGRCRRQRSHRSAQGCNASGWPPLACPRQSAGQADKQAPPLAGQATRRQVTRTGRPCKTRPARLITIGVFYGRTQEYKANRGAARRPATWTWTSLLCAPRPRRAQQAGQEVEPAFRLRHRPMCARHQDRLLMTFRRSAGHLPRLADGRRWRCRRC